MAAVRSRQQRERSQRPQQQCPLSLLPTSQFPLSTDTKFPTQMHTTLLFTLFAAMAALAMINATSAPAANWVEFNGANYKIFGPAEHRANHARARAMCQQHSAELASIHGPAEDYFIRGLIAHLVPDPSSSSAAAALGGVQGFHIGLQMLPPNEGDRGAAAKFLWTDNSAISYGHPAAAAGEDNQDANPWGKLSAIGDGELQQQQQANGRQLHGGCVIMAKSMDSSGDWAQANCAFEAGFVCKSAMKKN